MLNNEKEEGKTKWNINLRRLKLVVSRTLYSINHCQKWKYFQNSRNFFGLW